MQFEILRDQLHTDGVVNIKGLLDSKDVDLIDLAISKNLKSPSPFGKNVMTDSSDGSFFIDYNNWQRIPEIYAGCTLPAILNTIRSLTSSRECWLFHDTVLVKSGAATATPWHQDQPYFIFKGDLNLSVWIPTSPVPRNSSSLLFWRGSHKSSLTYVPKDFANGKPIKGKNKFLNLQETQIPQEEIINFEMDRGDFLVFFHTTAHASKPHVDNSIRKSLSIRFLLDGASLTKNYNNATPPFDRMGVDVQEDGSIPSRFPKVW